MVLRRVGALAGAGMYPIAVLGTAAVITANVALRPLGRRIDRHPTGGTEITVDYRFQAVCADNAEAHLRALLVPAVTGTDFQLRAIRSYDTDHHVTVTVTADHRDDRQLEAAISRLSLEPTVTAVSWTVLTESTKTPDDIEVNANGGTHRPTGRAERPGDCAPP